MTKQNRIQKANPTRCARNARIQERKRAQKALFNRLYRAAFARECNVQDVYAKRIGLGEYAAKNARLWAEEVYLVSALARQGFRYDHGIGQTTNRAWVDAHPPNRHWLNRGK